MSGRRCRALRREFIAKHGRPPMGAEIVKTKVKGTRFLGLMRKIFTVDVVQPSEWRRLKKAHKESRAA